MGAINLQGIGMKILGIAAGAFVDNLARKNFTSLDQKILGAIEIAAGVLIPKWMKSPLGEGLGDGLIAVGTINLLKSFSVISGVGAAPVPRVVPLRRPAISPGQSAISGGNPFINQTVSGMSPSEREMMMGALYFED
jgi:hypothetical protein